MTGQLLDWAEDKRQEMDQVLADYKADMVNSPPHYNKAGIEVIDVIEAYVTDFKSYCLGNVIKYACRSGYKGHEVEDWKKARYYLDRLIELEEYDDNDPVPDVPEIQGHQ